MKAASGREVSCAVLVVCDGGNGREGTAESTERLVVKLGGLALRARGDAFTLSEILQPWAIDCVAVGCASRTEEDRAVIETARTRGIMVAPNPEVLEAWVAERRRGIKR
jgi:hypothetical protein